jgi:iodotyrosine deiodinase
MKEKITGSDHFCLSGTKPVEPKKMLDIMSNRRSVRRFSSEPIPRDVIEDCIAIAASAPSGANSQPWSFVLVEDPEMKRKIRMKSEEVEKSFYAEKITDEWKSQLEPLSIGDQKPFLEEAPYLICIFLQKYSYDQSMEKRTHYYSAMSVGIASGFLITALHLAGISCLTYTPAPMTFLSELLKRPENEKPYMILAAGYPHSNYQPPDISKKAPPEYLTVI